MKIYVSELKSKKVPKIFRTVFLGPFYIVSEAMWGGLKEPYWEVAARALESAYFAVKLGKTLPLETLYALIEISNVSLEKWKDLLKDLVPWVEKDLASVQTKNIKERKVRGIGKKEMDRKVDAVADFLWLAVNQFYDLLQRDELPALCLVHRKVFWTTCPLCAEELPELEEEIEEMEKIPLEEMRSLLENDQATLTEEYLKVEGKPETLHRIIDDVASKHKTSSKNSE